MIFVCGSGIMVNVPSIVAGRALLSYSGRPIADFCVTQGLCVVSTNRKVNLQHPKGLLQIYRHSARMLASEYDQAERRHISLPASHCIGGRCLLSAFEMLFTNADVFPRNDQRTTRCSVRIANMYGALDRSELDRRALLLTKTIDAEDHHGDSDISGIG